MEIITPDKFIPMIGIKHTQSFLVDYHIAVEDSIDSSRDCVRLGPDEVTYIRRNVHLLRKFWKNPSSYLTKNLKTVGVRVPIDGGSYWEDLKNVAEDLVAERHGNPLDSFLVAMAGEAAVLNPNDFRIYIAFDLYGRAYGAITCYNRIRNFKVQLTKEPK